MRMFWLVLLYFEKIYQHLKKMQKITSRINKILLKFRFIVRDFEYDENQINEQKKMYAKLLTERDKFQV